MHPNTFLAIFFFCFSPVVAQPRNDFTERLEQVLAEYRVEAVASVTGQVARSVGLEGTSTAEAFRLSMSAPGMTGPPHPPPQPILTVWLDPENRITHLLYEDNQGKRGQTIHAYGYEDALLTPFLQSDRVVVEMSGKRRWEVQVTAVRTQVSPFLEPVTPAGNSPTPPAELRGCKAPVPLPTLNAWGIIVLIILLLGSGIYYLRK